MESFKKLHVSLQGTVKSASFLGWNSGWSYRYGMNMNTHQKRVEELVKSVPGYKAEFSIGDWKCNQWNGHFRCGKCGKNKGKFKQFCTWRMIVYSVVKNIEAYSMEQSYQCDK